MQSLVLRPLQSRSQARSAGLQPPAVGLMDRSTALARARCILAEEAHEPVPVLEAITDRSGGHRLAGDTRKPGFEADPERRDEGFALRLPHDDPRLRAK